MSQRRTYREILGNIIETVVLPLYPCTGGIAIEKPFAALLDRISSRFESFATTGASDMYTLFSRSVIWSNNSFAPSAFSFVGQIAIGLSAISRSPFSRFFSAKAPNPLL